MNHRRRVIRNYQQTLAGSRQEIFPLLCPVREKEWLQDWNYNMIYSESGYGEKGCIFETNNRFGRYQWIITKHDRKNFGIQFVKTMQEKLVVIIDIDLEEKSEKMTICNIQYTFISISGEVLEDIPTEEEFIKHMREWEDSLNFFLTTGKMYE